MHKSFITAMINVTECKRDGWRAVVVNTLLWMSEVVQRGARSLLGWKGKPFQYWYLT